MTKSGSFFRILICASIALLVLSYLTRNTIKVLDRRKVISTELAMIADWYFLERFNRIHGHFPLAGYVGTADVLNQEIGDSFGGFVSRDAWGNSLLYACSPEGEDYLLVSLGLSPVVNFSAWFKSNTRKLAEDTTANIVYSSSGPLQIHTGAFPYPYSDEDISDQEIEKWLTTWKEYRDNE